MTRYRCTHCGTVFEGGGVRDCCLPAAVSEQKRLRRKLKEADLMGRLDDLSRRVRKVTR